MIEDVLPPKLLLIAVLALMVSPKNAKLPTVTFASLSAKAVDREYVTWDSTFLLDWVSCQVHDGIAPSKQA